MFIKCMSADSKRARFLETFKIYIGLMVTT